MRPLARGDAEAPSDHDGIVHANRDDAGDWKMKRLRELMAAGYGIDTERAIRT